MNSSGFFKFSILGLSWNAGGMIEGRGWEWIEGILNRV
jgi:hypothetical protein